MNAPGPPKVSIGLPVYDGENYLEAAVESILAQTYGHFELIISDNASTDETESIARAFAARDSRVRYYRSPENRGATWNHRRVLELARGEYFRWHGHDDLLAPTYLERCVSVLDHDAGAVLSHALTSVVDGADNAAGTYEFRVPSSSDVSHRFQTILGDTGAVIQFYGTIRRAALQKARPLGNYVGSDWILLAELAFQGRFAVVSEYLFTHRHHLQRSVKQFSKYDRIAWFDPTKARAISLPTWRRHWEYGRSIRCSELPLSQCLRCFFRLVRRILTAGVMRELVYDFRAAARRLLQRAGFAFRPAIIHGKDTRHGDA